MTIIMSLNENLLLLARKTYKNAFVLPSRLNVRLLCVFLMLGTHEYTYTLHKAGKNLLGRALINSHTLLVRWVLTLPLSARSMCTVSPSTRTPSASRIPPVLTPTGTAVQFWYSLKYT